MGAKLTPKVILEGTRLTFKTEIAFRLNEHPRFVGERKYRYHCRLSRRNGAPLPIIPGGGV